MKINKLSVLIGTIICMSFLNVAMAERKTKPIDLLEVRVAELEALVTELKAAQDVVVPSSDLTGKTYCIYGQGTWLSAGNNGASVTANPFSARVDFISSTELTVTGIYDLPSSILLPSFTMSDVDDLIPHREGTYTVVGNSLTATVIDSEGSETNSFTISPDAGFFAGGFFERSVDDGEQFWESGMIIGVRAASCD